MLSPDYVDMQKPDSAAFATATAVRHTYTKAQRRQCRNKGTTANATNMPKYAQRDSVAIVQHNTELVTSTPCASEAHVTCPSPIRTDYSARVGI